MGKTPWEKPVVQFPKTDVSLNQTIDIPRLLVSLAQKWA